MWTWVATIVISLIEVIFGDHIKAAFFAAVALMAGAFGVAASNDSDTQDDTRMVYSKRLKSYLQKMDTSDVTTWYRAKEQYNESGVRLDHNFDNTVDWFLGKSCDVRSAKTGALGEWAVGKNVWVVVFGKDKVAFVKDSLPEGLDETIVKRCSVSS